jgi:integrase
VRWHVSCFASAEDDGLIFTSSTGAPLRRGNFRRRVWLPALSKAGLSTVHFHDLRHTGNTLTATAGAKRITSIEVFSATLRDHLVRVLD